ncbi:hypothetical protein [Xanthobacter variabilis]|uniref:hypothetical protein n=1 Tax=Xanthobacter variabilis TaxID=3119932 RepID=UPI00374ECCD9
MGSRGPAAGWAAWRGAIALAVAYGLVGQLVLASAVLALAVGPERAGSFRTVLCTPSGGAAPEHAPAGSHLPACCQLGCGFLNTLAPTPPGGGLAAPLLAFVRLARLGSEPQLSPPLGRRSAHLARAPPPAA